MTKNSLSVRLETLPWPKVQAWQVDCPLLVLPLGATEQHGPALPINTDSVIAEALCQEACSLAKVPMAPTLNYTSSVAHTSKWPGTFSLNPKTFIDALSDLLSWAVDTGWKKILIVNAHAGNDAPMRVAVDEIRRKRIGAVQVGYVNTFYLSPEIESHFTRDAVDLHANKGECDLIQHLAPETIDHEALPIADDPDRTPGLVFSYPVSQTSLNGTTGAPSKGCARDGAALFRQMCDALVEKLERAKVECPPLPEKEWLKP